MKGVRVVCMCVVLVWQEQRTRGPDIPEAFSFGFLAMSFPPQQSKAVLQHFCQMQAAGLGSEDPELSPHRPTDGHQGVRAAHTAKVNALPYC